jgi:hypothetical protein
MNSETLHEEENGADGHYLQSEISTLFRQHSYNQNISKDSQSIRSLNNVLNKHLAEIMSVSLP